MLTILILALLLAGCVPLNAPSSGAWQITDLRVLEAPNRPDPALDLVAAYARLTATDLEVRADFLGSPGARDYDLYLTLSAADDSGDNAALPALLGGEPWQIAAVLPAQGQPRAFDRQGQPLALRARILRDTEQDAATVRLSQTELAALLPGDPRGLRLRLVAALPGAAQAEDRIGPLAVDGPAVSAQARLLLIFWDALPAATPAQALRRFDGAHTGPYGQRHGLRVLLEAAHQSGVPLALLDLRQPEPLAALEALGGRPLLDEMLADGLLIVPETAASAARPAYRLPESKFFYGPNAGLDASLHRAAFAYLSDPARPAQAGETRLIPLPDLPPGELQAAPEALTVAVRTALLEAALSGDPGRVLALGGSLPASPWADSLIAGPALRYIAGHPWISALDGDDLLALPAGPNAPRCPDLLCLPEPDPVLADLEAVYAGRQGLFSAEAARVYHRLSAPAASDLRGLRAAYTGQIGGLLAAAEWEQSRATQATCAVDLDADGAPECLLSSPGFLALLDPEGGRLTLAAAWVGNQPVQIVGPRSQLAAGLGDPFEWRPERGVLADPQEVPGAFADPADRWAVYQTEARPGEVIFSDPASGARKVFTLTEHGLRVTVSGAAAGVSTHIPLLLLDRRAYQPGFYARYSAQPNPLAYALDGAARVTITAQGADLSAQDFTPSLPLLARSEDPNAEYPPGHYLPFPLMIVQVQPGGEYAVEILVSAR